MNLIQKKFIFTGAILLAVLPLTVFAQASFFISPLSGSYKVGDPFSVLINVNTGGQPINAANAQISFDNSRLEVKNIGYSNSIFSLWTEEPTFSNPAGSIKFSGGLPSPGFIGASGSILRVTFKAKAQGVAPVVFISGSALANDGLGTNIVDAFKGGIFNISGTSGVPPQNPPKSSIPQAVSSQQVVEKPVEIPLITDWPKSIEEGTTISIRGLGFPNAKILVSVQKGSGDPVIEETFSGADGRFIFTHKQFSEAGFYRLWAKNVSAYGSVSGPSEVVSVEVTKPLFFRIGNIALNYTSILVTFLALIVLGMLLFGWIWIRIRKEQQRRGKEISEAEKTLHYGFDKLKDGLFHYISYLTQAGPPESMKRREGKTKKELEEELENIEKGIEKEIEDIDNVK